MFATYTLEVVMDDYRENPTTSAAHNNSRNQGSSGSSSGSSNNRRQEDSPTTLIAAATSITITLEQSKDGGSQQFLAVMVPHDMVEASLQRTLLDRKRPQNNKSKSSSSSTTSSDQSAKKAATLDSKCLWLEQSDRVRLSRDLLPRIHSIFASNNNSNNKQSNTTTNNANNHHIMIRAIFSLTTGMAQHAPADVVLLDLPPPPSNTTRRPQSSSAAAAAMNTRPTSMSPSELLQATNGEPMACNPDSILKMLIISQVHIASSPMNFFADFSPLEIPLCPVCLHRIDPVRLGLPKPLNSHLCSKFCPPPSTSHAAEEGLLSSSTEASLNNNNNNNSTTIGCPKQRFLRPWPEPSHCVTCRVIQDYQTVGATHHISAVFCNQCALHKTLWVCLTCGFCGCGRYSNKHAEAHFLESGHSYSLELATLRIWDYGNGEFAHRVDLLECPAGRQQRARALQQQQAMAASLMASAPSAAAAAFGGGGDGSNNSSVSDHSNYMWEQQQQPYYWNDIAGGGGDEKSPKKAIMIGEEYEALLQSALEDQSQHFEGEISRLRAALTAEQVDMDTLTQEEVDVIEKLKSEISELRTDLTHAGRELLDSQAQEASHRADSQRLLREQQVTQELLKTIQEETKQEQEQGKRQMEELEQQIDDLTANLKMRRQFSQDQELTNAHIFGTMSSPDAPAAGSRASAANNKKGKLRRLFRK